MLRPRFSSNHAWARLLQRPQVCQIQPACYAVEEATESTASNGQSLAVSERDFPKEYAQLRQEVHKTHEEAVSVWEKGGPWVADVFLKCKGLWVRLNVTTLHLYGTPSSFRKSMWSTQRALQSLGVSWFNLEILFSFSVSRFVSGATLFGFEKVIDFSAIFTSMVDLVWNSLELERYSIFSLLHRAECSGPASDSSFDVGGTSPFLLWFFMSLHRPQNIGAFLKAHSSYSVAVTFWYWKLGSLCLIYLRKLTPVCPLYHLIHRCLQVGTSQYRLTKNMDTPHWFIWVQMFCFFRHICTRRLYSLVPLVYLQDPLWC